MFHTVMVPLDGSAFGECALPMAMSIARQAGATLHLVRVAPPLGDVFFWAPTPGSALETQLKEQVRTDAMAYLESVGGRLKSAGAGPITYAVTEGEVVESIGGDIARDGAQLVVMSSHGRGHLERFWLGSIADELIRSLPIPVLLVRPDESHAVPDFSNVRPIRHILVAVDGTPWAERVLSPALALGKALKADFTLVRIMGPSLAMSQAHLQLTPALSGEMEKIKNQQVREAEEYLKHLADHLRADGVQVRTRVLFATQPAVGILEEAAAGADLIALETHGRHGLSRLLMGGITDKVVRGSSLPVLVCRAVGEGVASA